MKALHFGAGNIGKGFIGYFLHKNGYEVCFVDVNQEMVDQFNKNNSYLVELLDDEHTVEKISPVSALNSITQEDEVIDSIVSVDLITTSVGAQNLARIAPVIVKGLLKRVRENKKKLDIIANENAINASTILKQEVERLVSTSEMEEIESLVGFPNSAIDRLALSKKGEEGEIALVEPIYEWVINQSEMVNVDVPLIKEAIYVKDLKPYIERKLYIVNMGHATTAYLGFLAGEATIQSALRNHEIEGFVRETMQEAAQYFIKKFAIHANDMNDFIEKTLNRFNNKNIRDDLLRVGRAPIRKLGYDERLVKPMRELYDLELPIEHLTVAVAAGYLFDNSDDEESVTLQCYIMENGIGQAISHFSQIEKKEIRESIIHHYQNLKNTKGKVLKLRRERVC
jgi:mannitol-1-phosphate 5-dehydrogenase